MSKVFGLYKSKNIFPTNREHNFGQMTIPSHEQMKRAYTMNIESLYEGSNFPTWGSLLTWYEQNYVDDLYMDLSCHYNQFLEYLNKNLVTFTDHFFPIVDPKKTKIDWEGKMFFYPGQYALKFLIPFVDNQLFDCEKEDGVIERIKSAHENRILLIKVYKY